MSNFVPRPLHLSIPAVVVVPPSLESADLSLLAPFCMLLALQLAMVNSFVCEGWQQQEWKGENCAELRILRSFFGTVQQKMKANCLGIMVNRRLKTLTLLGIG
jgi:hypothetical protein